MRLAQAARKLGITTEDIVSFLAKKEITIVKDSNTKLADTSIDLLYSYFGKPEEEVEAPLPVPIKEEKIVEAESLLEEKVIEAAAQEIEEEEKIMQEDSAVEAIDPTPTQEAPSATIYEEPNAAAIDAPHKEAPKTTGRTYKTVSDLLATQEQPEQDEASEEVIIKAEKVNLKGLQVLGKIELPEKPEKPKKESPDKEEKATRKVQNKHFDKRNSSNRTLKNRRELSPKEIRDREQRKAKKKRLADEALKKKQKENYYTEQVLKPKQKAQKKQQAKKKGTKKEVAKQKVTPQPKPKTALGKFWRWLNT